MTRGVWRDPERMGGTPCIVNTRIPVSTVVGYLAYAIGNGDPDPVGEVVEAWPVLTPERVVDAVRFAAHAAASSADVTALRRRVQAAEKAARTRIDETKAAGFSLGRGLARWAAKDAERRAAAMADVLEQARALHAESCEAAGCAMCAVLATEIETMGEAMAREIADARERAR